MRRKQVVNHMERACICISSVNVLRGWSVWPSKTTAISIITANELSRSLRSLPSQIFAKSWSSFENWSLESVQVQPFNVLMMFDVFSFTSPRSRLSWRSWGNVHRSWFERPGNQEPRDFARAGIAAWPILIHSVFFSCIWSFVICFSFILAVAILVVKEKHHFRFDTTVLPMVGRLLGPRPCFTAIRSRSSAWSCGQSKLSHQSRMEQSIAA